MSTIPANAVANVVPSVLAAGGSGVDVIGLCLSQSTRIPIGTVQPFPNGLAVTNYFGAGSAEDQVANGGSGLGSGYFGGFDNSPKKPASLLFAQYNSTAVAAFLRGANVSSLTLSQLQAIAGVLNIITDGYPRNVASLNLSAATSFTSAATIIASALNAADPTEATVTASLGATFTGTQAGTNLTTSAVTGFISVGDKIAGTGVAANTTIISQTSGTTGGAGVYVTSLSGTASAAACTASSTVLDVTAVATGSVVPGEYVTGAGVTPAVILSQISGAVGGIGFYQIAGVQQQVASEAMTITGTPVTVVFDSVSGAFVITSGITGVASTMAFATGSAAVLLSLTSATGAVISQGAAAAVPAGFMNALIVVNRNWVTFFTSFDPDGGAGNTIKQAFSAWKNSQNNRFAYICWDPDLTPTVTVPATSSLGYILAQNSDSGTCLIQDATNHNLAPFIAGAAASIDFTKKGGRTTFAFRAQAGLVANVTDPTIAQNLAGNPQTPNSFGNGYNFYGAYGAANANYIWFQRGLVTGPFRWLDSYINQIWLNNLFQNALLVLQGSAFSIPYSVSGRGLIESALNDPIQAGLNFGAYGPAAITSAQAAIVNGMAGAKISDTLQANGFYLQILPAVPATRSARTSPPATFWYIDQGSVQSINLSSVALS